jgi:WD40 repeat protein
MGSAKTLGRPNATPGVCQLAVSILEKPKSSEEPLGLRDWAVDLLNQNSPTKFSADTLNQLKSGAINLSSLTSLLQTANPGAGIAASPDGNHVAAGLEDGSIAIWELSSGRLVRKLSGGTDPITAVIYSPDGRRLIAGSISGLLTVWGAETGLILSKISGDKHAVLGMALSPDQKTLLVRSADRYLRSWNLTSLRPVADITLDFAQ